MRWGDICWESRTVSFQRSLVRPLGGGWKTNSPKTKQSVRKVSLPERMLILLAEHKVKQDEMKATLGERWQSKVDFVFTTSHGSPLDTRRLNTRVFKRIVKDAGLPKDLTLYSLRHSCASLLFAKGVELKVASQRLGHYVASYLLVRVAGVDTASPEARPVQKEFHLVKSQEPESSPRGLSFEGGLGGGCPPDIS